MNDAAKDKKKIDKETKKKAELEERLKLKAKKKQLNQQRKLEDKEARLKERLQKKQVKKVEKDRVLSAKKKKNEAFALLPPLSVTNQKVYSNINFVFFNNSRVHMYRLWI